MAKEIRDKEVTYIKFFPSYEQLEELPQAEIIIDMTKEELLKKLGLKDIDSDYDSVFIELRNIKAVDQYGKGQE